MGYQPPNHNMELFMEKFNQILFNSDYNIDLSHLNKHSPTQEFVDSLHYTPTCSIHLSTDQLASLRIRQHLLTTF